MDWVDIGIIVFLALMAVYGCCKGLFKMVFSIFSFVVVIIVALFLAPKIADRIEENGKAVDIVSEKIQRGLGLEDKLTEKLEEEKEHKVKRTDAQILSDCGIPLAWAKEIIKELDMDEKLNSYKKSAVHTISKYICDKIAVVIIRILVFAAIVILLKIALLIVYHVMGVVESVPVISGLNRMGGGVIGFLEGILLLCIFGVIVVLLFQTKKGDDIMGAIYHSQIGNYILRHNPLMTFFY